VLNESKIMDNLGREIREHLGDGPPDARRMAQKRALVARVAVWESPRKSGWKMTLAAAAGVALVIAVGLVVTLREPDLVPFSVGKMQTPGYQGMWVQAFHDDGLPIEFEGGSRLDIRAHTAVRMIESDRKNVRVELSDGELAASIKGNGRTRWMIEAGPFRATVLGTAFTMSWDPKGSMLGVSVAKGVVLVQGAGLKEHGIRLAAGERLKADGRQGTFAVDSGMPQAREVASLQPASPTSIPETEATAEPLAAPARIVGIGSRPKAESAPERGRWKAFYEWGDYEGAVKAALEEGLDGILGRSGAEDLWLLADAARYARKAPVAEQALRTIRDRFPGTERSRTAAFVLGRVSLELKNDAASSASWFRTYLSEDPHGPLAEEAQGRLVGALEKGGRIDEARQAAGEYLSRYPNGVFSGIARGVIKPQDR